MDNPQMSHQVAWWVRWILAVTTAALMIGVGCSTVFRAGPHRFGDREWGSKVHRTDFTVYQLAGRAVLDGTDLYEVRNRRGWAYVYPPPFAILMAPLAKLSVFWGALLWYVLSVALLAWATVMCVRMVRQTTGAQVDPVWLVAVPVVLLLIWIMSGLARGQASVLMCWFVVAAVYWQRNGRELRGGACLAGAVILKAFPVVMLAYFVWRRKWRFVLAALVALMIGTLVIPAAVFGWQKNLTYLREWTQKVALASEMVESERTPTDLNEQLLSWQKLRNQSLTAALWRITGSDSAKPLAVVIGLGMAATIWYIGREAQPSEELFVVSAFLVWTLLIPPISETHYFVMLVLPLAVLTSVALSKRRGTERRLATAVLILFGIAAVASEVVEPLKTIGYLCWISLAVWAAVLFLAARRTRAWQPGPPVSSAPIACAGSGKITTGISLVLPMYNESPGVDVTLRKALDSLDSRFSDFEIVVADDASTDDSAEKVACWTAQDPRIRLVRLMRNQRFGGALQAGLAAARKEYLFYTDFDLQVGLECLPHMLGELAVADVLTGYSAQQVKHANWRSTVISWGYNVLVRTLFGLQLHDINFGFKVMRRAVYAQLTLRSRSPFVDAEMFIQAQRLGYTIKEEPVPFSMRQIGASHIRRLDVIAWTVFDMICLWLRPAQRQRKATSTSLAVNP